MKTDRRGFLQAAGVTVAMGAAAETAPPATPGPSSDLCFTSGRELARLVRARKLSAREVMKAHLARIARVNPRVNAIVAKLDDDRCLALADEADRQLAKGERVGPLHGLPFAFKDLEEAVGFPCTRGSPIFKDDMPKADTVLVLSVMAGFDPRDPGGYPSDPSVFARPLDRDVKGVRVAWCPDLGGLPLDRRVRSVLEAQRKTFESLGCIVEDACPDLSGADEVFLTLRLWMSGNGLGSLLPQHREQMKPEAVWQIESGSRFSGADVARAMQKHGEILERVRRFQEKHEFLACAVNQVPPFDATLDWPHEIEGVAMVNYVAWMKSASRITTTFRPAASVPAGFTADGLPVGIQIVGRYRDDFGVLQMAHAFEQATGFGNKRPLIAQA